METKQYFVKLEGSFILTTAPADMSIELVERSILSKYDGRMTEIWDIKDYPDDDRLNHIDKKTLVFRDSWRRLDIFEVTDEFPGGYVVWNIGRHNFPYECYVPIARDIGNYHVDRPKCIKVKDEKLALTIMDEAAHGKGFVGRFRFQSLCGL